MHDQLFVAFDLDSMYDANGTHMPGMIGYEVFRRFITTVDYGAHTVTLTDPNRGGLLGQGSLLTVTSPHGVPLPATPV